MTQEDAKGYFKRKNFYCCGGKDYLGLKDKNVTFQSRGIKGTRDTNLIEEIFKHKVVVIVAGGQLHILWSSNLSPYHSVKFRQNVDFA